MNVRTMLILFPLVACKSQPAVTVDPVAAECLLDRDTAQNACVRSDAGYEDRQACLEHVRSLKDCTKGDSQ